MNRIGIVGKPPGRSRVASAGLGASVVILADTALANPVQQLLQS